MEKYIGILRKYKDTLQDLHWNTSKDYARHLLFERLMNEVPEILDRFVEVYMGNKGMTKINGDLIVCPISFNGDLHKFIKDAQGYFNVLLVSSNESVQNVIVDILEMFDRHLYLL